MSEPLTTLYLKQLEPGTIIEIERQASEGPSLIRCQVTKPAVGGGSIEARLLNGTTMTRLERDSLGLDGRREFSGELCSLIDACTLDPAAKYGIGSVSYDVIIVGRSLGWAVHLDGVMKILHIEAPVTRITVISDTHTGGSS